MSCEHEVDLMNLFASAGSTFEVPLSLLCYGSYRLLSIGIYYNPTASPSTIVLSVSMHLPVSIASQELAQID